MRTNRKESGFTLAEVMVASAIFVVIIGAALTMYERSNRTFKSGLEAANVQQNTRIAFEKLASDMRMAGFDFDRDGIPTATNQAQQPDEQIEYIARSAIVFRGNFDFDTERTQCTGTPSSTEVGCDNGRERRYESTSFPIVTTGNDEIVAYALVSQTASANTDSITFFADTAIPRRSYPGGAAEAQVTIPNVDLSNAHPPYNLERITLDETGALNRTVIAENIRSLDFTYYEDTTGNTQLKDVASTPATIAQDDYANAVGGLGRFDPANLNTPTPQRLIRAKIQSMRVSLVGMNENPDNNLSDSTDTIAPNYRKYQLETLIVPRNAGRRGTVEQETRAPGAPTLTRVCIGYCGIAYVEWQAPPQTSTSGAPDQYAVLYDSNSNSVFSNIDYRGNVLFAYVTLPDPSASYYFAVESINSYGSAISQPPPTTRYSVANATTPGAPTNVAASGGGSVAAKPNVVTLTWRAPAAPASGNISCSVGSAPAGVPTAEISGWQVERASSYAPSTWVPVVTPSTPASAAPVWNVLTGDVTWNDTSVANCVNYQYRIATVERCQGAGQNTGGAQGISAWTAPVTGAASSNAVPAAPQAPTATGTVTPSNNYDITLTWPAVTTDTGGNPINIAHYVLYRTRYKVNTSTGAATPTPLSNVNIYPNTTGANWAFTNGVATSITYLDSEPTTDPVDSSPFYYEYRLTAQQCSSVESTQSPLTRYPCPFGGGTITAGISPAAAIVDGSGTVASPWILDPTSVSLVVQTATPIQSATATYSVNNGTPSTLSGGKTGPPTFTTVTFPLPAVPTGGVGIISVTLTDTSGCVQNRVYAVGESSNNCCLVPISIDTSLVTTDAPSGIVYYRLRNVCSETLSIRAISLAWNTAIISGSDRAVISFPKTLGTGPSSSTTSWNAGPQITGGSGSQAMITGSQTIAPVDATGTSDDYWIKIAFQKGGGGTLSFSSNPISYICVQYQRTGVDTSNRTCKIAPSPSSAADVCP